MAQRVLVVLAFGALIGCSGAAQECDRDCLIELTDDYVAGLAANDPGDLPLSDDLILVENLHRTSLGDGLWSSATAGATDFSIHVPDVERQTAGWMGMMQRDGEPAIVAIRLRLEGGEIVEAEHLVTAVQPANLARLEDERPGLMAGIPAEQRLDDGRLIDIAESYYDALDDNDGSLTPFAQDCERRENGMVAAEPGGSEIRAPGEPAIPRDCAAQLSSGFMTYIDRIEHRRVFAADPVTGLVMGLSHFRHAMDFEPYEVTAIDGSTIEYGPDSFSFEPFDLPAAHVFKIGPEGQMHEIEAMGFIAPYASPTGWE